MDTDIRKRIELLKELNGFKTDAEIIGAIFRHKRMRKEIGKINEFDYIEKNKGSFSACCSGQRKFKPEDYLAIEYALNTSMAYIIEGRGEISEGFKPSGIRYAACTDTIGNYETLIQEDIINNSDEYDKTLIDYMIEYKSKNGFAYFSERDLLPLNATGGFSYSSNCLRISRDDNTNILKILCEVLPVKLLIKYFNGFFQYGERPYSEINEHTNTSFSDEVMASAIKREDLRKELAVSKRINLDSLNKGVRRNSVESLGEGLFINYALTAMIKYALNHDVENSVREELLESAIRANKESFESILAFQEDELKIDEYGYITDIYGRAYYGSIAISSEAGVNISQESNELLNQLNRQIHDYHEFVSNHSKISAFKNELFADKKDNKDYYDFFKLMNEKGIKAIPVLKEHSSKDKDLFEIPNSEKSRIPNWSDDDFKEIVSVIKQIDEVSMNVLNGQTYYLVDPSIYMLNENVNYIMPKDIVASNKYSNLVYLINRNFGWDPYVYKNEVKINSFLKLIKLCGIKENEIEEFIQNFELLSEEQTKYIDKTKDWDREFALKMLGNQAWVKICRDEIIKKY